MPCDGRWCCERSAQRIYKGGPGTSAGVHQRPKRSPRSIPNLSTTLWLNCAAAHRIGGGGRGSANRCRACQGRMGLREEWCSLTRSAVRGIGLCFRRGVTLGNLVEARVATAGAGLVATRGCSYKTAHPVGAACGRDPPKLPDAGNVSTPLSRWPDHLFQGHSREESGLISASSCHRRRRRRPVWGSRGSGS